MKYSEKLKHPKWQKKRLEILLRDEFTCQMCGDTETELQVHHLKYTNEPYDAPDSYLQTLCKHCHELETYANRLSENVLFVQKILSNVFCKFKSGKILISSIDNENILHIGIIVKQPLAFLEIMKTLVKPNT